MKNAHSKLFFFALVAMQVFGCMPAKESQKALTTSSAQSTDAKISAPIRNVMAKLAQPSIQAADVTSISNEQVKVDSSGNIQCYVFLAEFNDENVSAVRAKAAKIERTDANTKVIQAWISHLALNEIAALEFITQVSPPDYGRPHSN
jgi:hypothetical protein